MWWPLGVAAVTMLALVLSGVAVDAAEPAPRALRFGIYPGGYVGKVHGDGVAARAEDAARRLAALDRLRGDGRSLVLHLYSEWNGRGSDADALQAAVAEAEAYTRHRFPVELVVRYRPAVPAGSAPRRYARFVAAVVRRLAPNRRIVGIQVGNEANVGGAPAAADGAYPGAIRAVARGVVAAHDAARKAGRPAFAVGFNWAAAGTVAPDAAFWRGLRRAGGLRFPRAVVWVGVDLYPGTWTQAGTDTPVAVRATMLGTLSYVRRRAMRDAGLGARVALQVSENGFPTGAGRSEQTQATLMAAAIDAVDAARGPLGITDYRWFDLRDADSAAPGFENGYGVLRDDYSEKPAFRVLESHIAARGR